MSFLFFDNKQHSINDKIIYKGKEDKLSSRKLNKQTKPRINGNRSETYNFVELLNCHQWYSTQGDNIPCSLTLGEKKKETEKLLKTNKGKK